jgi:SAM-dependent methyltransferase
MALQTAVEEAQSLKIDLGCGPNKKEGYIGVDSIAFDGVDVVCDLSGRWPWDDGTVDAAHASHVLEHFGSMGRVHFVNELYRVLKPGAQATLITPHWASGRAYGDPTHQWPPVCAFWTFYLLKDWRDKNAPHTDAEHLEGGFNCDFDATWGFSLHPAITVKSKEAQEWWQQFGLEATQDIFMTLTKRAKSED